MLVHVKHSDIRSVIIRPSDVVLIEYDESPYDMVEMCDYVMSKNAFPFLSIKNGTTSYVKTWKHHLSSPTAGLKIVSEFNDKYLEAFIFGDRIDTDVIFIVDSPKIRNLVTHLKKHMDIRTMTGDELVEEIRSSCELMDFKTMHVKSNHTNTEDMKKYICAACLRAIRKSGYGKEYTDRMLHEIDMYIRYDLLGMLYDILMFKKAWPEVVMRGSANSSLVMFLLGVSGIDPIKYRIPFERFINSKKMYER